MVISCQGKLLHKLYHSGQNRKLSHLRKLDISRKSSFPVLFFAAYGDWTQTALTKSACWQEYFGQMEIQKSFVFNLTHTQSAGIVPDLSSDRLKKKKKKVGSRTLFLFSLNINTTVDSIIRDHGMEKDSQRRSESRTDSSAASCSQAEKRPLNNNILINAPLPCSVATGWNRWRDYWELERRVTEQGPSWPRPSILSLSASAVWRGWFGDFEKHCDRWGPADLLPL